MTARHVVALLGLVVVACREGTPTTALSAPSIRSFVAEPASILAGASSTLVWQTAHATTVTITGVGVVSGSSISVSPSVTTTYTLTASNSVGSATATTTVTVMSSASVPDILSFTASPATIMSGGTSTLAWSATGATALSISSVGAVSGTSVTVTPTTTTTYVLTASNSAGSATATTTVTVTSSASVPDIVSFTASPATIMSGGTSTLALSVMGATALSISGVGAVSGTSVTVTPTTTTTYVLTASNSAGSATASATVTVQSASLCGNRQIDPGEACDASATPPIPASTTCQSLGQGYTGGSLSCDSMCHLVTSQCTQAATTCTPNMTQPYYNGPAGTEGVGTCAAGVETCSSDGSRWVVTTPDVEPQTENCGNPLDVACNGQIAPPCTPSTQHPRLWITPSDIPRLQQWAVSSNPLYKALSQQLAQAETIYSVGNQFNAAPYNGPFYLNGAPNPNWPDNGTSGVGAPYAEAYAEIFAFMAFLDPTNAASYAQKARNLLMYEMNAVVNCPTPAGPYGPWAPYCGPLMATYNRANYVGEAWG